MNENKQRRQKRGDRPDPGSLTWDESTSSAAEAAPPASTDAHSVYVKSCQDRGVLPCSRESFDADQSSGADLQQLKALAMAADQGEGQHIYTHPRDSNNWKANAVWHEAASPAVVLDLIARIESNMQKVHSATASGDDLPHPWRNRLVNGAFPAPGQPGYWLTGASAELAARDAEIADLRAAASAATKPTADLSKLPRYDLERDGCGWMKENPAGKYVLFFDVQSLLATKPAALDDRNDVLEEAANLCEEMEGDMFDQYKGRGKHAPNNPYRADPYMNGQSDGAGQCADAIRALRTKSAGAEGAAS